MSLRYLLPLRMKWVGLFLVFPHVPLRWLWEYYFPGIEHQLPDIQDDNSIFTNAHLFFIASTLSVLAGLFILAFSRERVEDEQISQLRLDSLRWAIYLNYALLILSLVFTNGINFIDILRLNLLLPLVFFILRFRWVIYLQTRNAKSSSV